MREAVIADIHGNKEALEAVLKDIETQEVDRIVCLGDTVGYGPEPNECLEKIMPICEFILLGNHGQGVIDKSNDVLNENAYHKTARISISWTFKNIRPENLELLKRLQSKKVEETKIYVHGSPIDPIQEYLGGKIVEYYMNQFDPLIRDKELKKSSIAEYRLQINFAEIEGICINSHNHKGGVIICPLDPERIFGIQGKERQIMLNKQYNYVAAADLINRTYKLRDDEKAVINVGSVGQPRDEDKRASYAVIDHETKTVQFCKVDYERTITAKKIIDAGLPEKLARRLFN